MAVGPALTHGDKVFPLNKVTNTIGRKDRITNLVPDVDLATVDPERAVSRKHAEANYQDGHILLRDLGSTNGTTVNGDALQLQVECELQDGDAVSLGGFEVVFASAAKWPRGVKAEWPPEEKKPVGAETKVYAPEETAVLRPADETAIMPPPGAGEAPAESELAGAADVYAPAEETEAAEEAGQPADDGAMAMGAAISAEAAAPSEGSISFVPCTNHPHLPAVGICPGCLDPFCVDDLVERPGQPLVCNRCAGIQARLGVSAAETASVPTAAYASPAQGFPPQDPAGPGAPPQAAPPQAPGEEKKKRWPF